MDRLVVTGSHGTIGQLLTRYLRGSYDVYEIDAQGIGGDRYFACDVSRLEELETVFRTAGQVRCVVHLAGDSRTDAPWDSVLMNNIIGTRNIYECAKMYHVEKVVFASSNHVTGAYEGFPPKLHMEDHPRRITIHHPIRPDGDYAVSKVFGEAVARQYYELYGVRSICLRIGTVTQDDDPASIERMKATWLSHRDLIQLVERALAAPVDYGVYYGVSNNDGRFWDIGNAQRELGYQPQDNASVLG